MGRSALLRSLIVAAGLAGCTGSTGPADAKPKAAEPLMLSGGVGAADTSKPKGVAPVAKPKPHAVQLDVHQITVPHGAISRNEEFWKRIDENKLEPATYDLLLRNGIRAGVAPNSEWEYFRTLISKHPATSQRAGVAVGAAGGTYELTLKKGVDFQNLFYLNDVGELVGRTYELCDDLLAVTYQPAPRRPDNIRLKLCPLVRGVRRRFEVTGRGDEREIRYVHPERLYDLNLEVEVPSNSFLVVAPSTQAQWPTSLGNTLLITGGDAERLETILLLVPQAIVLEEVSPGGS